MDCSEALGLESTKKINDSQLSSIDSFPGFGPSEGKLNNYKAWCSYCINMFFEIDLLEVRNIVSALTAQEYQRSLTNYIKTFKMKYSCYGVTWFDYKY